MQVKLNLSLLEDISDDIDFCFKLAKEESVIILPGTLANLASPILESIHLYRKINLVLKGFKFQSLIGSEFQFNSFSQNQFIR